MEISLFKNIRQSDSNQTVSILEFLNDVKFGKWREKVKKINSEKEKSKRQILKKNVPYVTISGKFEHRSKEDLIKHSGFICLDFDDLENVNKAFEIVSNDPFTFSVFRSISGKGLAVIVKIDSRRHLEAFLGLEVYFANKYQLYVDRQCKDVSRARFVSYDPELFTNNNSDKFTKYIPKSEQINRAKLPNVITGNNDIKFIIDQIVDNSLDITDSDYSVWLRIGFAISEEFGEMGRDYYHAVSQFSTKYSTERCNKQYDHCLKSGSQGINFSTFLYYAKNSGVEIVSEETKQIVTVSSMRKNSGSNVDDTVNLLLEVNEIPVDVSKPIVEKVFKRESIGNGSKLSKLESIEIFLNTNYNLKRNEITRFIELNSNEIDTKFLNTIYIKARKEVDDKIKFEEIDRIIGSDFVPDYNPLKEFFEKNFHIDENGLIEKLADSIVSNTGADTDYKLRFIRKWLVGIVASIHGEHSPLLLALTGGQRSGKTQFFRRLLPDELKPYYAESKLDAGKDDEILMTQKILIMDDEFGGKSKVEAKRLKEITSKEYFNLREPYGRKNIRLKRLAVLAGTSNDEMLLNDPTGNRRILPVNVLSINKELYNSIDKKALIMEAFKLYESGFEWELNEEDVELLNSNTEEFNQIRPERELILRYFRKSLEGEPDTELMQSMEIKAYVEQCSGQRLSVIKFAQELKSLNFEFKFQDIDGNKARVYFVKKNEPDYVLTSEGVEKQNVENYQIKMPL